jgi:hypothetical protein
MSGIFPAIQQAVSPQTPNSSILPFLLNRAGSYPCDDDLQINGPQRRGISEKSLSHADYLSIRTVASTNISLQPGPIPCRPRDHLSRIGKLYPTAWKQADGFRARKAEFGGWPDWCFLLENAWCSIARDGETSWSFERVIDAELLGAMGTWRATQGVYQFDSTIFDAVIATPLVGNLPCEVLHSLPDWCVYVETPGMHFQGDAIFGFYARLGKYLNNGGTTLRFLLDGEKGFSLFPLPIGPWSLTESRYRMMQECSTILQNENCDSVLSKYIRGCLAALEKEPLQQEIEPFLSLLLYLCSQNAEIGDGSRHPVRPTPKKTKKGERLFAPDMPTKWDVGVRLGAALRHAMASSGSSGDGTHARPRAHIRRGHWHLYRTGPTKRPDGTLIPVASRKFSLKWLPPIAVNVDSLDDLPATIRPVKALPD